jgi:hypothetical protein
LEGEFEMKITIQKLRLPAIFVLNVFVGVLLGVPAVKSVAQTSATAKQTGGSGTLSLTGSMNTTRALHTSTLLAATTELFNPATGQ